MKTLQMLIVALFVLWGTPTLAQTGALAPAGESRGALLYRTHCSACHSANVHWRKQNKARDWRSLRQQIRRWQGSIGLGWTEDEITDVALYLNAAYYRFPVAKGGKSPEQEARAAP